MYLYNNNNRLYRLLWWKGNNFLFCLFCLCTAADVDSSSKYLSWWWWLKFGKKNFFSEKLPFFSENFSFFSGKFFFKIKTLVGRPEIQIVVVVSFGLIFPNIIVDDRKHRPVELVFIRRRRRRRWNDFYARIFFYRLSIILQN